MPTIGPAVGNMKAISTHPGIIPASTGNNDAFSQLLSDPDIAKDDALAGKSHEKRQSKGDTPTEPITVRTSNVSRPADLIFEHTAKPIVANRCF